MTEFTLQPAPNASGGAAKRTFDAIPEDTIVHVEVVSVTMEEKPVAWQNGPNDTHRISFHFIVTEGEYANRHLWGNTSTWFSKDARCKFRIWVQELLGVDVLPVDYKINIDNFAGTKARVLVGNKTKTDGTITDFAKDLLRAPSAAGAYQSVPEPTEEVY